jgi:V/A-type H+-transporting ATPase subunit I
MIVRMKELLLFTSARSVDATIQTLGELGVVDICESQYLGNGTVEVRTKVLTDVDQAINQLSALREEKKIKPVAGSGEEVKDPHLLVDRILAATRIRAIGVEQLNELREQLAWYQNWGEGTRLKDLKLLRKQGIFLRLYHLDAAEVNALSEEHTLVPFTTTEAGKLRVALVSTDPEERLLKPEVDRPKLPLAAVKQRIIRKKRQIVGIDQFFTEQTNNIPVLEAYRIVLADQLAVGETLGRMGDIEGKVKYLRGYLPETAVGEFEDTARGKGWAFQLSSPEHPEDVPVYIKNPKWISIINPVMKFIDIVPGYREVDVSIYFLVAFALFFAMLVGDAGYGLVFFLATLLLRKQLNAQLRVLLFVLSGATVVWGVLSGTYFGAEGIAQLPVFRSLMVEEIASFGVDNTDFMMHLSFLIGAIHLTVARGIRAVQVINSTRALSEVGWAALIWGLFFLTEQLVLGKPMPSWGIWLFVGGALLVALFSQESKSLRTSILVSLANLPLSLISGFSDIVSYVRLFAVGMATAAVAASFNNMILPSGIADLGFLDLALAAIALLLGHGLNIVLALMAVMVHGIRLNMLEFAGHLGVEFSGEAYKPFKLLAPRAAQAGRGGSTAGV